MSKVYVNVSVLPTLGCEMTIEGFLDHKEFVLLNNSVCKILQTFIRFSIVNSHLWRIETLQRQRVIDTIDLAKHWTFGDNEYYIFYVCDGSKIVEYFFIEMFLQTWSFWKVELSKYSRFNARKMKISINKGFFSTIHFILMNNQRVGNTATSLIRRHIILWVVCWPSCESLFYTCVCILWYS